MDPSLKPELSSLARVVVGEFRKEAAVNNERKLTVNPVVSKLATWYERLRNAMEYREEEVILRAAIERILKRRLLLGGNAKTTAEPLVRELIWARYLPDNTVPESIVETVEKTIDLFLRLRFSLLQKRVLPENVINEWIYHLMSSSLEQEVNPNTQTETIANFMYQVVKEQVEIQGQTEETKNAQVYVAVRRSFARDDIPLLRYHLFKLYFGKLTEGNLRQVADNFQEGFGEIARQLVFEKRDKVYNYVKKRTAAFFILEDLLKHHTGEIEEYAENPQKLENTVIASCEKHYRSIASKVRRALVRSVLFVLLTKVIFAFAVEGTYERFFYGQVIWSSIILNTSIPPVLMIVVGLLIKTPGIENSKRIYAYIKTLLYEEKPRLGEGLLIKEKQDLGAPFLNVIFTVLWFLAFLVSFGLVVFVLSKLHFNLISQLIFLFFLAIVSFLSYRIAVSANMYTVGEKQGIVTPLVDFLFLPVIRVGRKLTQEFSRFNLLLIVVDFFIETPFKVLVGFFEQWFLFLHAKREEME